MGQIDVAASLWLGKRRAPICMREQITFLSSPRRSRSTRRFRTAPLFRSKVEVGEGADVRQEWVISELSPGSPIPTPEPPIRHECLILIHGLRQDGVLFPTPGSEIKHLPNPAVLALNRSRVGTKMTFADDFLREIISRGDNLSGVKHEGKYARPENQSASPGNQRRLLRPSPASQSAI